MLANVTFAIWSSVALAVLALQYIRVLNVFGVEYAPVTPEQMAATSTSYMVLLVSEDKVTGELLKEPVCQAVCPTTLYRTIYVAPNIGFQETVASEPVTPEIITF